MPVQRMTPNDYYSRSDFYEPVPQKMDVETTQIPTAVWILLGIALAGCIAVALYAMKTLGDVKKTDKKE